MCLEGVARASLWTVALRTARRLDLHRHPSARRRLHPKVDTINIHMGRNDPVQFKYRSRLELACAANGLS